MPYVRGFLKLGRRNRPGRPETGLPDEEHPVDPDYGIDEGGGEMPDPPPGLWPPLTPEQPWRPIGGVDPGYGLPGPRPPTAGQPLPRPPITRPGTPGQPLPETPEVEPPITLPPGAIWPPLPPGVHGHYWALVAIGGMPGGTVYRYVVIDADAKPPRPGHRPDQGLPGEPPREPKG